MQHRAEIKNGNTTAMCKICSKLTKLDTRTTAMTIRNLRDTFAIFLRHIQSFVKTVRSEDDRSVLH